jgi:hypothetical protein
MEPGVQKLDIVGAIAMLRAELSEAILASSDETLRFTVGEIELELEVAAERAAEGGVKFWVVEAGGGVSSTNTHTVRISLTPQLPGGGPVFTGGHDEVPARPPDG